MKVPFAEPWIGVKEAKTVYEAVVNKMLRYGDFIKCFEEAVAKYIGVKYAVAVSSGTAALHVALIALNIGSGDEVIVPSFSCASPVIASILCKARPVFADVEPETLNLDPCDVKRKITPRTKAIIPIHYAGHPAEMSELLEIAEKYGLYIIEDAAEALGAIYKGKMAGSMGHISILAFSPNKIITTGEGGMVLTSDPEIAEKARIIMNYGQKGRFNYVMLGHNYHITEFQAAMGLVQMNKIEKAIERRRNLAKLYNELLEGLNNVETPIEKPHVYHVYMSYYIRVPARVRDALADSLGKKGVETRIYFPPLHLQPAYQTFASGKLPVTEDIARRILNLPMSPCLNNEQVEYVTTLIQNFLSSS